MLSGDRDGAGHGGAARLVEGAEIDDQRTRAAHHGVDLVERHRHRRDGAGGEQHVGGQRLGDGVGEAVDARVPLADALEAVASPHGQFAVEGFGNARSSYSLPADRGRQGPARMSPESIPNPSAGMIRIRFDGSAFASQPGWAPR
jgi:hypothetical protein